MDLLGDKNAVLEYLRVFSPKRSAAGAFVVPIMVLSWKNRTGDNVLFFSRYKKNLFHSQKIGFWFLVRFSFQNFQQVPLSFYIRVPPTGDRRVALVLALKRDILEVVSKLNYKLKSFQCWKTRA